MIMCLSSCQAWKCLCVCIHTVWVYTVWAAERAQDGHRCYYCLRVSISLCLSILNRQPHSSTIRDSILPHDMCIQHTRRHTWFTVILGTFRSFLLFSNLHKIIIIMITVIVILYLSQNTLKDNVYNKSEKKNIRHTKTKTEVENWEITWNWFEYCEQNFKSWSHVAWGSK